ncbi:MAG TPA: hypothetical protein VI386_35695, partial [Candidatus Sulfotelmatobacter sp.]
MKKRVEILFAEHQWPFTSSRVTAALLQLESPLPNAKHISVSGSRETFAWRDLADMDARISRALQLIRSVKKLHPDLSLCVLPEYSLPVERAFLQLQRVSEETNTVIISGSDNIQQLGGQIYVQSYVAQPGVTTPVIVTKATLSKWEEGYVDIPPVVTNPLFTWSSGDSRCWLAIFLGVDLLLASRALENVPYAAPGIIVTPMCSQDNDTFRVYADTLLRNSYGVTVLLVNSVGEACGHSAAHVASGAGRTLLPAVELPGAGEGVAVIELRCEAALKESDVQEEISKQFAYTIRSIGDAVSLSVINDNSREHQRAVLNPALFDLSGKKLRLAFLAIEEFAKVADSVRNADFEVLAILGQHDLAVTHLDEDSYNLL